MDFTSTPPSLIDEAARRCFEAAWRSGQPAPIERFLPPQEDPRYLPTLEELVTIELEFRWKLAGASLALPAGAGPGDVITPTVQPRRVEDYLRRFPRLNRPDIVQRLQAEESRLRRSTGDAPPEPDATGISTRIRAESSADSAVEHRQAPPGSPAAAPVSIPGYEILGELGRGGMGVVYRARQISLKRLVALKMILAAGHAGPEDLARFHTEAEAVAQFQHPNIVQVYEIGTHNGLPFFSLEYVDGGSLAQRMPAQPLSPEQAARVVELLARAMQHAHQRGIVHRDLKPANVLLMADGTPKITDFGLAKQLEADTGQTHTGAVLGTPCYMAPEQAAGRTHAIGPAADIYALGAILYDLLTGRPPFKAATITETLEQVQKQEPVPPSKLRPHLPRDVETICLKCLAKEPEARYASALALAQDLERFVAAEPILARRAGLLARSWRRVRRNPLVAAAVVTVIVALGVAGFFAPRAFEDRRRAAQDRQMAALTQDIDAGLQAPELTDAYLDHMEGLAAALNELAPERAAAARQRLVDRFADRIREEFRDRLNAEAVPRIEMALGLLAGRDASRADTVRTEFNQRRSVWQPLFALAPPFDQLTVVFDTKAAGVDHPPNETLLRRLPGSFKPPSIPLVMTRIPAAGYVQLTAVFDPSWKRTGELRLILNAHEDSSYHFVVRLEPAWTTEAVRLDQPSGTPLADAQKQGFVRVYIARQKQRRYEMLATDMMPATELLAGATPDGSLRLEARREGDRLTFQVNRRDPLAFHDPFPLSVADPGRLALSWPEAVGIKSLHAMQLPSPPAPSILEAADAAYLRGNYEQARTMYQQVALRSRDTRVRQEARYKEGMCLLGLKREQDALRFFEAIAADGNPDLAAAARDTWSLRVDCQLIRLYQRQTSTEALARVGAILDKLIAQEDSRSGSVPTLISFTDRYEVVARFYLRALSYFVRKPEELVQNYQLQYQAAVLFRLPAWARIEAREKLIRAYCMAGKHHEALQIAVEEMARWRRDLTRLGQDNQHYSSVVAVLGHYFWLLQITNANRPDTLRKTIEELDSWLYESAGVIRREAQQSMYPLLIPRGRLHVALKEWKAAEADLQDYFREEERYLRLHPPAPENLGSVTNREACLLLGMIREQQGDRDGARAAWLKGVQQGSDASGVAAYDRFGGYGGSDVLMYSILASLTGKLTDAEFRSLLKRLTGSQDVAEGDRLNRDSRLRQAFAILNLPPEVFRQMWLTPRGREWARRIAFRELTFAEYVRVPIFLVGAEYLHQSALPGAISPEQEALLWNVIQDMYFGYLADRFKDGHVAAFSFLWKGIALPGFGWAQVKSAVEPASRGGLAYVFGHRYLRLKKPDQAAEFFRAALADAPADSPLRRLAQAEIDRLTQK